MAIFCFKQLLSTAGKREGVICPIKYKISVGIQLVSVN